MKYAEKDSITEIEKEILIMFLERQKMSEWLNRPGVLRLRRAFFLIRHMVSVEYTDLEGKRKARMIVSPMNFLYLVFDARSHI